MDDEGRLDIRHWDTLEQSMKDHPSLKDMSVLAECDAAILERNTAFSEKKAAFAEKETALFQRDVAYEDRNTAILECDAAAATLDYARDGGWNGQRKPFIWSSIQCKGSTSAGNRGMDLPLVARSS